MADKTGVAPAGPAHCTRHTKGRGARIQLKELAETFLFRQYSQQCDGQGGFSRAHLPEKEDAAPGGEAIRQGIYPVTPALLCTGYHMPSSNVRRQPPMDRPAPSLSQKNLRMSQKTKERKPLSRIMLVMGKKS